VAAENFKVKKGLEVGTGITANSDGINVTGIITATQYRGDGSGLTGVVASGTGVIVKDEGSAVGTAGTFNFVGSGVAATLSAGTATVTISSGGLTDVVDDTTPQLGGNLDLNSKFITGTGNIDITGSLDVSGISTTGFLEVGNLTNGRVPYAGSASGRLVDSANLTFDGTNLFVSGINVTSAGTTSTFGADIATRNLSVSGISTFNSIVNIGTLFNLQTNLTLDMINSSSTGGLELQNSNNIKLGQNGHPNWEYATFSSAGVDLKYQNQTKLTTTSSGITVPDLEATGTGTFGQIETDGVTLGTNNNTFAAKFIDDAVANFGTDNDLKISHDNTHARITNSTGSIVVTGIISAINAASIQGIDIKAPNATSTMIGNEAGLNMSGAAQCVAVGNLAMRANVSSIFNTAVGVQALGALGSNASSSYPSNTAVGHLAGSTMTTGSTNTLIGANAGSAINSSANTILGKYDGNQGGLDIRSLSGNIVIADGNSNVRFYINPNGNVGIGTVNPDAAVGSGNTAKLSVGIVSAHQFYGDGSNITGVTASGTGIIVKHDGSTVGTASTINFSTNLDVTPISAGIVTVTASGGSGSIAGISTTGTSVFNEIVVGSAVTANASGINAVGTAVTAGRFHALTGSFQAQIGTGNQGFYLYNGASTHLAISYSSSASRNQFRGNASGNLPLWFEDFSYIRISPKSAYVQLDHAESAKLVTDQAGVKITGVCTATSFSGSLDASNLTGTIANGRFPTTLPTTSGANLTNLPVPTQITIANEASDTTCNVLFTTAATGDLAPKSNSTLTFNSSTEVLSATKFSGSGETLTNLNASNIASGTMSASRLTGALPAISGASLTNVSGTIAAKPYTVTNSSSNHYVIGGENDPTLYLSRGLTYTFNMNASGHPFHIQTVSGQYSGGNLYTSGVTVTGNRETGTITFAVPHDAPDLLYYVCQYHQNMAGTIIISDIGTRATIERNRGKIEISQTLNNPASGDKQDELLFTTGFTDASNSGASYTFDVGHVDYSGRWFIGPMSGGKSQHGNGTEDGQSLTLSRSYRTSTSTISDHAVLNLNNRSPQSAAQLGSIYFSGYQNAFEGGYIRGIPTGTWGAYPNYRATAISFGLNGYGVNGSTTTTMVERFRFAASGALCVNGASNYGSSGQVLKSNGDAPPTWSSPTQARTTANAATSSLVVGASGNITITAAKSYVLQKIQTSAAAWVTLYTDSTSRSNDSSRNQTTDPAPGSGVIAEVITTGAATQIITPGIIGWNNDGTPSTNVYVKVKNTGSGAGAITVTLHYLALEI